MGAGPPEFGVNSHRQERGRKPYLDLSPTAIRQRECLLNQQDIERAMDDIAVAEVHDTPALDRLAAGSSEDRPPRAFVLAGGRGTRLWPLSRSDNPKQFHQLSSSGSMLSDTIARLKAGGGKVSVHVIASGLHAERTRADVVGACLDGVRLILEPSGKGTAIGVALAALHTLRECGDDLVLVVPSDHAISAPDDFWRSVRNGIAPALKGCVVTFGVPASRPETGFGYIEIDPSPAGRVVQNVRRFVEKPDIVRARSFVEAGNYYWNAGIFLFRASVARRAFLLLQPEMWHRAEAALAGADQDGDAVHLPAQAYDEMPALSFDRAIMEHFPDIAMVAAEFGWSDLGSWQALLENSAPDPNGNVKVGDVVTFDCSNSYLRSHGRLLTAVGISDMAIVATPDATLVTPFGRCQDVGKIVDLLERQGRPEVAYTPEGDNILPSGAWRQRILQWLTDEALPLWLSAGIDREYGGFHEALTLEGKPVFKPKRMRTSASQIYVFAVAAANGWSQSAGEAVSAGIDFIELHGRNPSGGWARVLRRDGSILDDTEDLYDTACVLLALAHAHRCGDRRALRLCDETLKFLDGHLSDDRHGGYFETSEGGLPRRSNPHMHLLEAFLAWHDVTADASFLERACSVIALFRSHFFDLENWAVREFFTEDWKPAAGDAGEWTEPGHHFEWAALLVDFAARSREPDLLRLARKLYSSAIASGLNRTTGLAFSAVACGGAPIVTTSRSWQQTEAIRAAIAVDQTAGPDMSPEIEARMSRLFRLHMAAASPGLWFDSIVRQVHTLSRDVPASIFYHLTSAFVRYFAYADRPRL